MEQIITLASNLLSPIILMFVLGICASLLRSDLRLPESIYNALAIYLLLAIGLKGGVELHKTPLLEFLWPSLVTLILGIVTPITAYNILRRLGKFDRINASARTVLGAGLRSKFKIGNLQFDFGVSVGWEPARNRVDYLVGSF